MKLIKCNRCALINTERYTVCPRCKQDLTTNPVPSIPTPIETHKAVKKLTISPYILVAAIVTGVSVVGYGLYEIFQ